jgi:predicted lipoprotein with Yx(FWY)xxD motif
MKKILIALSLFIGVHSFAQSATPVNVGDTVTMTVTANGTTPFTYKWFKNGTVIVGQTASTYVIPAAQLSDAASYTAQVTNSAGSYTTNTPAVLAVSIVVTPPTGTTITVTVTPAPKTP